MKQKRFVRILSLVMACMMMLGVVIATPITFATVAETTAPTPSGTWADEGNYDVTLYNKLKGQATTNASKAFNITSEKELAALAKAVNDSKSTSYYQGYTFNITASELDMSDHYWIPIGLANDSSISGIFYSNLIGPNSGVTIKGITVDTAHYAGYTPSSGVAFIGNMRGGTIKNITLDSPVIVSNKGDTGAVIGYHKTSKLVMNNVHVINANITASGNYVGGLVGRSWWNGGTSTVDNCSFDGVITVSDSSREVGGIAGDVYCSTAYNNCVSTAEIIGGLKNIGILVGYLGRRDNTEEGTYNFEFSNCTAGGSYTATIGTASGVGGFVGYTEHEVTVSKGVSTMNLKGMGAAGSPSNQYGGFIGEATQNATFTECYFGGVFTTLTERRVAGFIGMTAANKTYTFTDCQYDGIVGAPNTQAGAFIGRYNLNGASASFTRCVMSGVVKQGYGSIISGNKTVHTDSSWIGLVAGDNASGSLSFTNCFTEVDNVQFTARNDKNQTLSVTCGSGTTLTSGDGSGTSPASFHPSVISSANLTILNGYKPVLLSTLSGTRPSSFSSTIWGCERIDEAVTSSGGRQVFLKLDGRTKETPYFGADISWYDPARTTNKNVTINTTAKLLGLAMISRQLNNNLANYTVTVDDSNVDYKYISGDLFAGTVLEDCGIVPKLSLDHVGDAEGEGETEATVQLPMELLSLQLQLRQKTNETCDVRLTSTVDGLYSNYDKVGFIIRKGDDTAEITTTTVYSTLDGNGTYKPDEAFCSSSKYFFAVVITEIPASEWNTELEITPFIEYVGGERVLGEVTTFTLYPLVHKDDYAGTALKQLADGYQIVYTAATKAAAKALRAAIKDYAYSVEMVTAADNGKNTVTFVVDDTMTYFNFKVTKSGNNLVIKAGSAAALEGCAEKLASVLASNTIANVKTTEYDFFDWSGRTEWGTLDGMGEKWYSVDESEIFVPDWTDDYSPGAAWLFDFDEKLAAVMGSAKTATSSTSSNRTTVARPTSKVHRGDCAYYPDGSLEGYMSSVMAGADCVEADTRLTKDGVLVLMHDATLIRTTNVEDFLGKPGYPNSVNVSDWTYAQLQDLTLTMDHTASDARGFGVGTLYELLLVVADRVFLQIDDKSEALLDINHTTLYPTGGQDRSILLQIIADTNSYKSLIYHYGGYNNVDGGTLDGFTDIVLFAKESKNAEFIEYVNKILRVKMGKSATASTDYVSNYTKGSNSSLDRVIAEIGASIREDWWAKNRLNSDPMTYGTDALQSGDTNWYENVTCWDYMLSHKQPCNSKNGLTTSNGYMFMIWTEAPAGNGENCADDGMGLCEYITTYYSKATKLW